MAMFGFHSGKGLLRERSSSYQYNAPFQNPGADMLTHSREIKRRLEKEGWVLERVSGSHHVFRNPKTGAIIPLPHPKKDLGQGLVWTIYKAAGWPKD
jgi:predicted RNA binding protein YcfA (HicA-like mRNA interferase family)